MKLLVGHSFAVAREHKNDEKEENKKLLPSHCIAIENEQLTLESGSAEVGEGSAPPLFIGFINMPALFLSLFYFLHSIFALFAFWFSANWISFQATEAMYPHFVLPLEWFTLRRYFNYFRSFFSAM